MAGKKEENIANHIIDYVQFLLSIVLAVALIGAIEAFLEADTFSVEEQTSTLMSSLKKSWNSDILIKKENEVRAELRARVVEAAEDRGINNIVVFSKSVIQDACCKVYQEPNRPSPNVILATSNMAKGTLNRLLIYRLLLGALLCCFLVIQGWQISVYTYELEKRVGKEYTQNQGVYLGLTLVLANLCLGFFGGEFILHDSISCPLVLFLFCWFLHDLGKAVLSSWWRFVIWAILDIVGLSIFGFVIIKFGLNLSMGGKFGSNIDSFLAMKKFEVIGIIALIVINLLCIALDLFCTNSRYVNKAKCPTSNHG